MRALSLDISTSTGYALFEGEQGSPPTLVEYGTICTSIEKAHYPYPENYVRIAYSISWDIQAKAFQYKPDVIVIEETNGGKFRYSIKILEWIHAYVCAALVSKYALAYVSTAIWRKTLDLKLSKEDKKNNSKVNKANREARAIGKRADKKRLGLRGKVNVKHLAIRYVNEQYGLSLKVKDDDIADAITLGSAFFLGAPLCDGK